MRALKPYVSTIEAEVICKYKSREAYVKVQLPAKRIVCERCNGTGVHDPEAFSNGFTSEDFEQDPDFKVSYFRGDYDVTCTQCNGDRVVDVVDDEKLKPRVARRYWARVEEHENYLAECAAHARSMAAGRGGW